MIVSKNLVLPVLLIGSLLSPVWSVGAAAKGGLMEQDKGMMKDDKGMMKAGTKEKMKVKEAMSDDKMKTDDKMKMEDKMKK